MFRLSVCSFSAFAAMLGVARADVNASLDWCWNDHNPPSSIRAGWDQLPDNGGLRGFESAHDLLVRAKELARRPDRQDAAVEMAAICQGHNASAMSEIQSSKDAVLDWLDRH